MAQTELEGVLASLSGESLNRLAELVAAKLTEANPTSGRNSAVECLLPKQDVTGSNPAARSSSYQCEQHPPSGECSASGPVLPVPSENSSALLSTSMAILLRRNGT